MNKQVRIDALNRLRETMKKEAASRIKIRKFTIFFEYNAWLVHSETNKIINEKEFLNLVDGITDTIELAEDINDDIKQKYDIYGGEIKYKTSDNGLIMSILYRTSKKPDDKLINKLATYNQVQLLDGWGENGATELPNHPKLNDLFIDFEEKNPAIRIEILNENELINEKENQLIKLNKIKEEIDNDIDNSIHNILENKWTRKNFLRKLFFRKKNKN